MRKSHLKQNTSIQQLFDLFNLSHFSSQILITPYAMGTGVQIEY